MVTIKIIVETPHELFDAKGSSVGMIRTMLQLHDVRIQIAQQELVGYHFIVDGVKTPIEPNGKILDWPEDFFDKSRSQLNELFKFRIK